MCTAAKAGLVVAVDPPLASAAASINRSIVENATLAKRIAAVRRALSRKLHETENTVICWSGVEGGSVRGIRAKTCDKPAMLGTWPPSKPLL